MSILNKLMDTMRLTENDDDYFDEEDYEEEKPVIKKRSFGKRDEEMDDYRHEEESKPRFLPRSSNNKVVQMRRSMEDPSYQPRTCLMDEIQSGETYELVLSVLHGGAFMRYRIGDMYHCISSGGNRIPRLTFVDRTPDVIDIAGFTRITASSMQEVIRLSRLELGDWVLKKEFDAQDNPYLHMYVEIPPEAQGSEVTMRTVLTEHLALYFQYFDSDYGDLKKLLSMEPLRITVLKYGTIAAYESRLGQTLTRVNPGMLDIMGLLKQQAEPSPGRGARPC